MFLVFLEYIYGICYFIVQRIPDSSLDPMLSLIKNRVFSPHIMFFSGLIAFIGIILSFFAMIFQRKLIKLIAFVLHLIFFYVYMNYFLGLPVTKIFSFISKVIGYIHILIKAIVN